MAIFLIILSGPIQFLILANMGGLNVKPIHVCFVSIILFSTLYKESFPFFLELLRRYWGFFGGFLLYLVILLFSAYWANDIGAVFSKFVKFFTYFSICLLSTLVFSKSSYASVVRAVIFGAIGAVSAFIIIAIIALHFFGQNFFFFIINALKTGNFAAFQFSLYIYLSQYFGSTDPVETAGIRHATVNFLVFMFLLFMAIQPLMKQRGQAQRIAGVVAAAMSILIIILSFSRSSIALIGVVLMFVWMFKLRRSQFRLPSRQTAFTLAAAMIVVAGAIILLFASSGLQTSLGKLGAVFADRFAKLDNDERIRIYILAIQKLDLSPLFGYGGGARVATTDNHYQIHNVFLNAWFETGILGLLASITFFGALLTAWTTNTLKFMRRPELWALPYSPAWTMALPILPLINALQGGDGNFDLASFFCISAFYGWLRANDVAFANRHRAHAAESDISRSAREASRPLPAT